MYNRSTLWSLDPGIVRQLFDRARRADPKPINREPRKRAEVRSAAATYASGLMGDARANGYAGVAVVSIHGILTMRGDWMFCGSTYEDLGATLRQLAEMPSVTSIILDCDSPGGMVGGAPELADVIYDVAVTKAVIAVCNPLAASACYWIASQCSEIVCTPSGEVGSVGVYALHTEFSKADEMAGVKSTLVSAAAYKTEGNEYEPLTDDAKAYLQRTVDITYAMFLQAVARGRGVSVKKVQDTFGQGRVMLADDALAAGLVDRIASLDEVIGELVAKNAADSQRRMMARDDRAKMRAEWEQTKKQTAGLAAKLKR